MTRYRVVAVLAVLGMARLAVAQLSLEPSPTPNQNVKQLRWLDTADAAADFQRQVLQKHDTRFIAMYGFATIVPGTDEARHSNLIRHRGVRYIEGTSDTPASLEEVRLNDKAEIYAERYNIMLLKYLSERHPNT